MRRLPILIAAVAVPILAHGQTMGYYAGYPTYGAPNSVQFQIQRGNLDLADVDVEGDARFTAQGDSDTIGAAFTYFDDSGADGERYDAHYEKAWRPFAGSRDRALLDVPVNLVVLPSSTTTSQSGTFTTPTGYAGTGSVNAGLEIPVAPNWSLTPRVAYGLADSNAAIGANSEILSGSVTSRYRFAQVGRGDLVLGDMVGYTTTVNSGIVSQPFYAAEHNWVLRNGVAYQWPLEQRLFGRQSSVRLSYVNTEVLGDQVAYRDYHEFAVSVGVRTREAELKNKFELLRFGLMWTNSGSYNAATVTAGYRF
ncbi:MAG TPA: hypothetical protein VFC47_02510 [Caulobacteraceae bacterium]|nr:hypothetical protein [Caulobacteraceae bacterium]